MEGTKIQFGIQPGPVKPFTFDYVGTEETSQLAIFEKVGIPITNKCMQGTLIPLNKKKPFSLHAHFTEILNF